MPLSRKRSFMDDCKHFRIAAEPRKYRQAGVGGVCPIWSAQEQNKEFNTKRTTDSSYDGMIPKCEKPSNISDSMVERTVKNVTVQSVKGAGAFARSHWYHLIFFCDEGIQYWYTVYAFRGGGIPLQAPCPLPIWGRAP